MQYSHVYVYRACDIRDNYGQTPAHYTRYEEDGLHKPLLASDSGIDHYEFEYREALMGHYTDVTPRKGYEFSEMELPMDPVEFSGIVKGERFPKFLVLVPKREAEEEATHSIYGWIDSYEPVATKGPSVNTRIRWHVDYWMTLNEIMRLEIKYPTHYETGIAFGQGRIKRGPASLARPDPGNPRKWVHSSNIPIKRSGDEKGPWIIVHYTKTIKVTPPGAQDPLSYTRFYIAFWGVQEQTIVSQGVTYYTIPITDVYSGMLEEYMGIAPSSIIGVYFSPVPPVPETIIGFSHYTPSQGLNFGWHNYAAGVVPPETYHITFGNEIATGDNEKYVVTDPIGTVYGTLPWGQAADRVVASVDVGSSGAWLNLEFKNGAVSEEYGEGRKMQLPLISAPITSNALSEYVLSGQQEYDRTTARIQQEQNLKSGIAGIGTSVIGGAVAGTVAAPGIGTIAGAAAGPALGAIGLAANYFIQGETDRKTQEATYNLMANQVSNVLISGGGSNWWYHGLGIWRIVKLVRDPVSAAELNIEQSELGYVTDYYVPDCDTIIKAGGPLRIEGLQLKGAVTVAAKQYIAALFARGVHIDLIP